MNPETFKKHVSQTLARTGGEMMHVDHYDFRQAVRDSICSAIDLEVKKHNMSKLEDKHLPDLFDTVNDLCEQLFIGRYK